MIRVCARAVLLAFGLGATAVCVRAAAVEVSPVSHELKPGQTALSMTLRNRAETETTLQVRGFVWTQDGGQDNLVPTSELLVAPAIFSIAPGRSQVLRVRVPSSPAGHEASYRLLIDEIPSALDDSHVRMLLRLSVPVFTQGQGLAAARLVARIDTSGGTVTLINQGGRRIRVHELTMSSSDGRQVAAKPMAGAYVLPGAERPWSVPDTGHFATPSGPLRLVALTDDGRVEVPLASSP